MTRFKTNKMALLPVLVLTAFSCAYGQQMPYCTSLIYEDVTDCYGAFSDWYNDAVSGSVTRDQGICSTLEQLFSSLDDCVRPLSEKCGTVIRDSIQSELENFRYNTSAMLHCSGLNTTNSSACSPNPCWNWASCFEYGSSYWCACPNGYTGRNCETSLSTTNVTCWPNPCRNNGTCNNYSPGNVYCDCPQGMTGEWCETDLRWGPDDGLGACESNPCWYGGKCVPFGYNSNPRYYCNCTSGRYGYNCQYGGLNTTNVTACSSSPCLNRASCYDYNDSYSYQCWCMDGYTGQNCETAISTTNMTCWPNPCRNNGTCNYYSPGNVYCDCPQGMTGEWCETDLRWGPDDGLGACESNPCWYGGKCVPFGYNSNPNYYCNCTSGRYGYNCQYGGLNTTNATACSSSPCMNWASCYDYNDSYSYQCWCMDGYTGQNCETALNQSACWPDTCNYNGDCQFYYDNSALCMCHKGYTGYNCETDLHWPPDMGQGACESNPCWNGGKCIPFGYDYDAYYCECTLGHSGYNCEEGTNLANTCWSEPCPNGGLCLHNITGLTCVCQPGYVSPGCYQEYSRAQPYHCDVGRIESEVKVALNSSRLTLHLAKTNITELAMICMSVERYPEALRMRINQTFYQTTCSDDVKDIFFNQAEEYRQKFYDLKAECKQLNVSGGACWSNPCVNGGSCQDYGTWYSCNCPIDFSGLNCETNTGLNTTNSTACSSGPCQHGGSCYDYGAYYSYQCVCADGYTGQSCEATLNQSACWPGTCNYNGDCQFYDDNSDYCMCHEGYTGYNCETDLHWPPEMGQGACESNPCWNGGKCIPFGYDWDAKYYCECTSGHWGYDCEEGTNLANTCWSEPCPNGGLCLHNITGLTCVCQPGYVSPGCYQEYSRAQPYHCDVERIESEVKVALNSSRWTLHLAKTNITELAMICMSVERYPEALRMRINQTFYQTTCSYDVKDIFFNQAEEYKQKFYDLSNECKQLNVSGGACWSNPCENGGSCQDYGTWYSCNCPIDFSGLNCETNTRLNTSNSTACSSGPCQHGGSCYDYGAYYSYQCVCADGYTGQSCEATLNQSACWPGTCNYNGDCQFYDDNSDYCMCHEGYTGYNCETDLHWPPEMGQGACESNPCWNGGKCIPFGYDWDAKYYCECTSGHWGYDCEEGTNLANTCWSEPCPNGGLCLHNITGLTCVCQPGYVSPGCYQEYSRAQPYHCDVGRIESEVKVALNSSRLTLHLAKTNITELAMICMSVERYPEALRMRINQTFYQTTCSYDVKDIFFNQAEEYKQKFYDLSDECKQLNVSGGACWSNPCRNGGNCQDYGTWYSCNCPNDFSGINCEINTDGACVSNPCKNGATCIPAFGYYMCQCTPNYLGETCDRHASQTPCYSSPCKNDGACQLTDNGGYRCQCGAGYYGEHCDYISRGQCLNNPCPSNATCKQYGTGASEYYCDCGQGAYHEPSYGACVVYDYVCAHNPCMHGASCSDHSCICSAGYHGIRCQFGPDNQPPYDPCRSSPCTHNGVCFRENNDFKCFCDGYHFGRQCEYTLPTPAPKQCNETLVSVNVSACVDRVLNDLYDANSSRLLLSLLCFNQWSHYSYVKNCLAKAIVNASCDISLSYKYEAKLSSIYEMVEAVSPACDELNAPPKNRTCERDYCGNNGKCKVDSDGSYWCDCAWGYAGPRCQDFSNQTWCQYYPCKNGAECVPYMALGRGYFCRCGPDSVGDYCETLLYNKTRLCDTNICYNDGTCYEDNYGSQYCVCKNGYSGPYCKEDNSGSQCKYDSCQNGGTCYPSGNDFYCSCPYGYSGKYCEYYSGSQCEYDSCKNGGTCYPTGNDIYCTCPPSYSGRFCEDYSGGNDPCIYNPCLNGGTCRPYGSDFSCSCLQGYWGPYCESTYPACVDGPCLNNASCSEGLLGDAKCHCLPGYTGIRCELDPSGEITGDLCSSNPCIDGFCFSKGRWGYRCQCPPERTGHNCYELVEPPFKKMPCNETAVALNITGCVEDIEAALNASDSSPVALSRICAYVDDYVPALEMCIDKAFFGRDCDRYQEDAWKAISNEYQYKFVDLANKCRQSKKQECKYVEMKASQCVNKVNSQYQFESIQGGNMTMFSMCRQSQLMMECIVNSTEECPEMRNMYLRNITQLLGMQTAYGCSFNVGGQVMLPPEGCNFLEALKCLNIMLMGDGYEFVSENTSFAKIRDYIRMMDDTETCSDNVRDEIEEMLPCMETHMTRCPEVFNMGTWGDDDDKSAGVDPTVTTTTSPYTSWPPTSTTSSYMRRTTTTSRVPYTDSWSTTARPPYTGSWVTNAHSQYTGSRVTTTRTPYTGWWSTTARPPYTGSWVTTNRPPYTDSWVTTTARTSYRSTTTRDPYNDWPSPPTTFSPISTAVPVQAEDEGLPDIFALQNQLRQYQMMCHRDCPEFEQLSWEMARMENCTNMRNGLDSVMYLISTQFAKGGDYREHCHALVAMGQCAESVSNGCPALEEDIVKEYIMKPALWQLQGICNYQIDVNIENPLGQCRKEEDVRDKIQWCRRHGQRVLTEDYLSSSEACKLIQREISCINGVTRQCINLIRAYIEPSMYDWIMTVDALACSTYGVDVYYQGVALKFMDSATGQCSFHQLNTCYKDVFGPMKIQSPEPGYPVPIKYLTRWLNVTSGLYFRRREYCGYFDNSPDYNKMTTCGRNLKEECMWKVPLIKGLPPKNNTPKPPKQENDLFDMERVGSLARGICHTKCSKLPERGEAIRNCSGVATTRTAWGLQGLVKKIMTNKEQDNSNRDSCKSLRNVTDCLHMQVDRCPHLIDQVEEDFKKPDLSQALTACGMRMDLSGPPPTTEPPYPPASAGAVHLSLLSILLAAALTLLQ